MILTLKLGQLRSQLWLLYASSTDTSLEQQRQSCAPTYAEGFS